MPNPSVLCGLLMGVAAAALQECVVVAVSVPLFGGLGLGFFVAPIKAIIGVCSDYLKRGVCGWDLPSQFCI